MKVRRGRSPGRCSEASHFKPYLRTLFRCRCAYCQTHDSRHGGLQGMTVDHFRPEKRYPHLRLAWTNLYYACGICNSHYKKDRPTAAEERAGRQFVDVCRTDSDEHFLLEWSASECRYKAATSTGQGLFTLLVLHFNDRPDLRNWWLELDDGMAKTAQELAQIRAGLRLAKSIARRYDDNDAKSLYRQLRDLEAACQARLESILEYLPFQITVGRPDR